MNHIARLTVGLSLVLFSTTIGIAKAQNAGPPAATSSSPSILSAVDYNFVAQANLGAPFQVESGRPAEKKATTAQLRDYAHLMVVTHIPVIVTSTRFCGTRASPRRPTPCCTRLTIR